MLARVWRGVAKVGRQSIDHEVGGDRHSYCGLGGPPPNPTKGVLGGLGLEQFSVLP